MRTSSLDSSTEFMRSKARGATVLLGTGAGIAFFMVMAHRTGKPALIAHTASIVVVADFVFTASAVVLQPLTGFALAKLIGWDPMKGGLPCGWCFA